MRSWPAVVLVCTLPCCSFEIYKTSAGNYRAHYGVVAHTGVEVVEFESPAGVESTTMKLAVAADAGRVEVELLDPEGKVRYRDRLRGGELDSELRCDPRPGVWRCVLDFADFSGNYSVRLRARSEPIPVTVEATGIAVR